MPDSGLDILRARKQAANADIEKVNTLGEDLTKRRDELWKQFPDAESRKKDEYASKMQELDAEVIKHKDLRTRAEAEIAEIKQLSPIALLDDDDADVDDLPAPAFKSAQLAQFANGLSGGHSRNKDQNFLSQIGNDFWHFLNKTNHLKAGSVKSRAVSNEVLPDGRRFNISASWFAAFGHNQGRIQRAIKHLGIDENFSENEITDALKMRRDKVKSMFTQHPLAGGAGELYNPTAIFAGNTGGLCEYEVDNDIEVIPYPKASFLECIPVRTIAKSWLLYARQTLRINNASAVNESVLLPNLLDFADGVTPNPIDFRPLKPESEFGFSQLKEHVLTFADTLQVSEEFLEDCPSIANLVETQLMENVRQRLYYEIINGNGQTGAYPQLVGLLARTGLSTRAHRGAATFMGQAMGAGNNAAGVAGDTGRDTIERAIFDGEAFGYNIDCAIVSLDDYIEMAFTKNPQTGERLYTEAQIDTIRGASIKRDIRMPAGTAIAGDFRRAVQLLMRRALRLDIGWVDKQFRQDMLTLRATLRAGLKVAVPHALIRITGI
jgi:hypothetical protein